VTHNALTLLTDEELLKHAWLGESALTTTDLERELAKRLQAALDFPELPDGFAQALEGYDPSVTKDLEAVRDAIEFAEQNDLTLVRKTADVLLEFSIDDVAMLRKTLTRLSDLERQIEDGELVAPSTLT